MAEPDLGEGRVLLLPKELPIQSSPWTQRVVGKSILQRRGSWEVKILAQVPGLVGGERLPCMCVRLISDNPEADVAGGVRTLANRTAQQKRGLLFCSGGCAMPECRPRWPGLLSCEMSLLLNVGIIFKVKSKEGNCGPTPRLSETNQPKPSASGVDWVRIGLPSLSSGVSWACCQKCYGFQAPLGMS